MKKIRYWIYESLGWLFCEISFRYSNLIDKYYPFEDNDKVNMEETFRYKVFDWFYQIGVTFYSKNNK